MSATPPPPPPPGDRRPSVTPPPPPAAGGPTPWGTPPPADRGSGPGRWAVFVVLGVLAVVVVVVGLLVLGGGDDDPSGDASPAASEPPGAVAGPAVADLRQELPGSFAAGEPIPVTLEEGDVSFLLTAVADDPEAFVAIETVADPDGELIYQIDEDAVVAVDALTNNLLAAQGEVSVLAPVHPGLDVRPGTYEIVASEPVEATVLIKSGAVEAEIPQFIDLNLWRVSSDVDASTLEQEVRSRVDDVLGKQNLSVGRVEVFEADPADVDAFREVDDTQAADICSAMTAAVGESRSLDLAILESISDGDVLGFSAGLPGSSPAPGVTRTCTIVATRGVDLATLAATMVHEGSHFMGLTHTTEQDGSSSDDFADTPECDASVDGRDNPELGIPGNPDGLLDEAECGVEGAANNYMFWVSNGVFPQTDMSADQAWALRRHPLVYAAP